MSARLLLRPDARWTATSDGVQVLAPHGEVFLPGTTTGEWLARLAPVLDGRFTLDRIADGLPEARRGAVRALLTGLVRRGVVREVRDELPHGLTDDELSAHAAQISYLGYHLDSAAHRFERYRRMPVAVVGGGALVDVLREALRRTGCAVVDAEPEDAGLVVQVCDGTTGGAVAGLCAHREVPLAQVVVADGEVWWHPAFVPGRDGHGWHEARRRLVPAEPTAGAGLDDTTSTVVATQVAHDLFRYATGLRGPDPVPRLVRFDTGTLASHDHRYLPTGGADRADVRDRVRALAELPGLDAEEFSRRAVVLVDPRLGVLDEVDEGDLAQLPLHVTRTRVSAPDGSRPVVTGAGIDFETARYRAVLTGVARYAALAAPAGPLAAVDAVDGSAREVAPPVGHRGVAAGYDWPGAVSAGALDHCLHLTVATARAAVAPFDGVDLDAVGGDPVLDHAVAMLHALGEPVTVHDVTGPLGVPTFGAALSGRTVAYGSGVDPTAALRECLHRTLLSWQSRTTGQPVYAPPNVPDLPESLRGPARPPRVADPVDPLAALVAAGHRPLLVPLDHDGAVHRVVPFVVRVVLT
ncbi:hypothetical protein GCM10022243_30290 [Saccharothrix violaceirubra]|uniref:YcaO domain-containing protein n=1 Tax=Saccharothrix violaceirubra TaxID=413306 RepID=A0A7W7T4Y0_9PSEU|nr:hypothetical protein [Saccharothrix violaceirubra]MBB4966654.1 hypothetical protein [Saccharothrix violaceirubra]